MSDDKQAHTGEAAPAGPDATRPDNAFNSDSGYSGQDYDRDAEAEQGRADQAEDTPRKRTEPESAPPDDPDEFKVPGSSGPRQLP